MNVDTPKRQIFISLEEQVKAVEREINLRRRVYANRVSTGRMSQGTADYQLAAMEAVLKTVKEAHAREQKELSLF